MSPGKAARTDIPYTVCPNHIAIHIRATVGEEESLIPDEASPDCDITLVMEAEGEVIKTTTETLLPSHQTSPLDNSVHGQ